MQFPISDFPLIIPCGGKSSRMGSPKGLLKVDGLSWYQHHIDRFKLSGGKHVVLVLGHGAQAYLDDFGWTPNTDGQWVSDKGMNTAVAINPQPDRGQFSSIQCGILPVVQGKFPGAFVLPVDMPSPERKIWQNLIQYLTNASSACIPSHNGRAGHPVLLSKRFLKHLLSKSPELPESRLDRQIGLLHKKEICYVDVDDPNVLKNVNTQLDFESM